MRQTPASALRAAARRAAPWLAAGLVGCGGGGGSGSSEVPPIETAPVLPAQRVSADSPVAPGCSGGAGGGTLHAQAEVEPFAAVNPRDTAHIVGVWQQDRWSQGGARAVVSASSFDGGRSWSRTLHPMSRCGGAAAGAAGDFERVSDPWVEIGSDGVVHLMALAFDGAALSAGSRNAMLASRSLDGGRSFTAPQILTLDGDTAFNDKNTLSVDALDPRFVYAVWDRIDAAGNGPTRLARSVDAGASWEPARTIYTPIVAGGVAQTLGNRIAVVAGGPQRGLLVDAFVQIDRVGSASARTVRVIRSADRGSSWGPPVTVAEHRAVGATDPATGAAIRDGALVPALAAAPDGTLWLAWQDARFSGGLRDAIAVSRSVDGGATWSAPVAANRDPAVAAFTPTLAVRADGLLGLMHFDLRPDTADATTLLAAAWLLFSRDGVSWTEASVWPRFDLAGAPQAGGLFLGDYQGLVAAGSDFLSFVALSAATPANRSDIFALRVSPAAGLAAGGAEATAQALAARRGSPDGIDAEAFRQRQQQLTLRALRARLPGALAADTAPRGGAR